MNNKVKKFKSDIKKSFDYYTSTGEVYVFSNNSNYGMNDKSFRATYVNKRSKVLHGQTIIEISSNEIDEQCTNVVTDGMRSLSYTIPQIRHLLSPIISCAVNIKATYDREVMKIVKTITSGF